MHRHLGSATTSRVRGIAIHPVFGDVDVQTAQIHRAKLIQGVINLVKLECSICGAAISNHLIEPFEDPTVNQTKICFPDFLLSCGLIKKVALHEPERVEYS